MTRRTTPLLYAFIFAAAVFMAGEALAAPVATVQSASGATLRRRSLASFASLNGRTPLNVGDTVRTSAGGKASLLFFDGSQLRLGNSTTVEITAPTNAGGGRKSFFRALGGEVWARMRPGSAAKTRTAVAGVRGTEILLQVGENDTTTLTVIEGVVDFYNEFGAVVVNASQQSSAAVGQPPTSPLTINNPGLLIEWTFDLDFAVLPREKFWTGLGKNALANQTGATPQARGDLLFDAHKYEDALNAYQQAEAIAPNDNAVALRIGYALLELGRLDESELYFRRALGEARVAKSDWASLRLIADTNETAAPAENPLRPQALIGLAWVELARNRPEAAQTFAQQAVDSTSLSAEARIVLGVSLLRQNGKLDAAIQALSEALRSEPSTLNYQAHAWLALALLGRDDRAGALKEAQVAVKQAPESGLARGHLALALLFNNRAREATREARRAVELNPDAVAARVALAEALLVKGDSDAAAREAAVASALDPRLPQGLYVLGLADAARRDYSHAARSLQASVKIAPEFLPAASALARVYTLMGREGEALTLLTDYQTRHPQSSEVLGALAQVYYQQGKYREAVEQYRKAVALQPNSALLHAELARLLLDDNQLNAALKTGQRAVFLAPQVGQYHALLGLIADFSRLSAYAEREYRTAIALDPKNALARIGLSRKDARARIGVNTQTQAFLFDPTVSRQLFRGGIDNELTLAAGTNETLSGLFSHRAQTDDGKIYAFGSASHSRSDGEDNSDHDDARQSGVVESVTWIPDARTNVLLQANHFSLKNGYNGIFQAEDDRSDLSGSRGTLAAKRRIGKGADLWLGGTYNTSHAEDTDPTSNSQLDPLTDLFPGLLVYGNQVEAKARTMNPELRLDYDFGVSHPSTLTVGASYARAQISTSTNLSARVLLFPGVSFPIPLGDTDRETTSRSRVGYVQLASRVNDKLSFVAQMRRQHVSNTDSQGATILGTPVTLEQIKTDNAQFLPSLLVNYQLDQKSALRFFAYKRRQDIGFEAFAPTETILSSEATALPVGDSGTVKLYEVDIERYFSPRTFGKVFLFHSEAQNLLIGIGNPLGSFTLGAARKKGVGVRLEQHLGKNIFANLLVSYNRTESVASGTLFQDQIAPYQPRFVGRLALNYIDPKGNKASVAVNRVGSFYSDTGFVSTTRPSFPARTTVDLTLAREPSLKNEYFVSVLNVFNARQIQFNGFPAAGRTVQVGYTRRF